MYTSKDFLKQLDFLLSEEIGRSHQTVNNDPVRYDDHPDVDVEIYANDRGKWSVKVTCPTDASLEFPLRTFDIEAEANHYARDCAEQIIRSKLNEVRQLVRNIILNQNRMSF